MAEVIAMQHEEGTIKARLVRAARLIRAWEAFELGRGMVPPAAIRYPELAALLDQAVDYIAELERRPLG